MTVRKRGDKRVRRDRRRIEIIPVWREVPDARLYALAVLEMVKEQAAALDKEHARTKKPAGNKEEPELE